MRAISASACARRSTASGGPGTHCGGPMTSATRRGRGSRACGGSASRVPTMPTGTSGAPLRTASGSARSGPGTAGRPETACPPGRCPARRPPATPLRPGPAPPAPPAPPSPRHGNDPHDRNSAPTGPWTHSRLPRYTTGRRNGDRDEHRVDVGQVVGTQDHRADGREVLEARDARAEQHPHQRAQRPPQHAVGPRGRRPPPACVSVATSTAAAQAAAAAASRAAPIRPASSPSRARTTRGSVRCSRAITRDR